MRITEIFKLLRDKLPMIKKFPQDTLSNTQIQETIANDSIIPTLGETPLQPYFVPGLYDIGIEVFKTDMHKIGKEEIPQFINWPEYKIQYLAKVGISNGFCYNPTGTLPYSVHLVFDTHTLQLIELEEEHLAFTSILDGEGQLRPIQSEVTLKKVVLDGYLSFNVLITGIKAAEIVESSLVETVLTGSKIEYIRRTIGYLGTGVMIDAVEENYDLTVTQGLEFILDGTEKVYNNPADLAEQTRFRAYLDGKKAHYIYIPILVNLKPDIETKEVF